MQVLNSQAIPGCFNIAIVISRYHVEVTQKLLSGAMERLQELGFESDQILSIWVPGVVDIPLTAQRLARTEKFAAIICLGLVTFGETNHVEYMCQQVSQGCQQVALTEDIPVIFGVLTTNNLAEAHDWAGGSKGNRGRSSVDNAFELISVLHQL